MQATDRPIAVAIAIVALAVILAVCAGGPGTSMGTAESIVDSTTDKLAQVRERGTLVLWTDPDYAP